MRTCESNNCGFISPNACGLDLQNEAEKTVEELTMVENASVPKAILVVTDETTNEEKSYEVDANLSENMTDDEKASLVETLKGREISNVEKVVRDFS